MIFDDVYFDVYDIKIFDVSSSSTCLHPTTSQMGDLTPPKIQSNLRMIFGDVYFDF